MHILHINIFLKIALQIGLQICINLYNFTNTRYTESLFLFFYLLILPPLNSSLLYSGNLCSRYMFFYNECLFNLVLTFPNIIAHLWFFYLILSPLDSSFLSLVYIFLQFFQNVYRSLCLN